jgi:ADP-ribose pyrophosphatase
MSEELFSGHGWKITKESASLPDGRTTTRTRAHYADTVHVMAFDDKGNILILREYRPFYKTWIWMLPSGHVDKETDRDAAADRELREETGFRAEKIRYLWTANATEKLSSSNYFYLASSLIKDPLPQDDDENIEVHALTPEEAYAKIAGSERVHLASAYGLLRYLKELPK